MTAFAGLIDLGHAGLPPWRSESVATALGGMGVGTARTLTLDAARFVIRQRIVTAEDRLERQPWPCFGGEGALLFDGRLDHRRDLIDALGLDAGPPIADGKLVALAFERWGPAATAARLAGDFAIALWDGRIRSLHLIRERLGRRPLYWHRDGTRVAFSTTLRGLLALPGVPRVLDEAALADFLALNHADQAQTVYRGISRVAQGQVVTLDARGTTASIYAAFDPHRRIRLGSDQDYVEAAREKLLAAVRAARRAIDSAPLIGGGGLDSALIAAVAACDDGDPLAMITIQPEAGAELPATAGHFADEAPLARLMAEHFPRLRHECVRPDPTHRVETDPAYLFGIGAVPIRGVLNFAWFDPAHRRARDMGAQAMLTGLWGNMTLTWNGQRGLCDRLREGRWLGLAREGIALGRRAPSMFLREVAMPLVPRLKGEAQWRAFTALRAEAGDALGMDRRMRAASRDPAYVGSPDSRTYRIHALQGAAGVEADITALIRDVYGLETRNALMDVRLAEWTLAIPVDQYFRNGTDRSLARRLLRSLGVPDEIAGNRRRGQQCPEWFARVQRQRAEYPARLQGLRRSALASGLIDLDRIDRLLADWPQDAAGAQARRAEYAQLLTRAVHVGSFIRWVEGAND